MNAEAPERTSRRLRSAHVARRPSRLGGTVLALGIIFALAYIFVLRAPPSVPVPQLREVGGTYSATRSVASPATGGSPQPVASGRFAASATGDAWGTLEPASTPAQGDAPRPLRSAYDATKRATVTTSSFLGRDVTTRTVGEWPPVWRVATPSPLEYQGLAAVVRSAVEDKDRTVGIKPLEQAGRRVWRAALSFADDDLVEVVVDQQTGLVVWHSETRRGVTDTFTATPDWGGAASPSPAVLPTTTRESGGSPSSLGASADRRTPMRRPWPRPGGRPATSRSPRTSRRTASPSRPSRRWIPAGRPPPGSTDRVITLPIDPFAGQLDVAQLYTRGLTWFTVQQLGPTTARKSVDYLRDSLRTIAAGKLSFQTTTLQYGAFSGRTAFTWYEKSGPTLLVGNAGDVVYITGALTRRELIAFAEGLEPLGGEAAAAPSASPRTRAGRDALRRPPSTPLPGSVLERLELFLLDATLWTHPVLRKVREGGPRLDAVVGVAYLGVVDVVADTAYVFHARPPRSQDHIVTGKRRLGGDAVAGNSARRDAGLKPVWRAARGVRPPPTVLSSSQRQPA